MSWRTLDRDGEVGQLQEHVASSSRRESTAAQVQHTAAAGIPPVPSARCAVTRNRAAHAAERSKRQPGEPVLTAYFAPLRARLSKRCAQKRELFLLAFAYRAYYSARTTE